MPKTIRRALATTAAIALGLTGAIAVAAPASALGCEVTSTADDGTDGTLRHAVETLQCSTVTFGALFDSPQTITLSGASGSITMFTGTTIVGPGSSLLTITRGADPADYSILNVDIEAPADFVVSGLTLSATVDPATGSGSGFQSIDDQTRDITLRDVVVQNQNAVHGAGIDIQSSTGTVSIYASVIRSNVAETSGGGVSLLGVGGTILFDDTQVLGNDADNGPGGGLAINAADAVGAPTPDVIIQNGSLFEANDATEQGGGIYAALVDDVTITDSVIDGNGSDTTGGGLLASDITGDLVISGSQFTFNTALSGGGLATNAEGLVSIADSRFFENSAGGGGALQAAGFETLDILRTVFERNAAGGGGALWLGGFESYGTVNVFDSDFIGNSAEGAVGGAIYGGQVSEPFTIARTNFLDNTVTETQSSLSGGAVWFNSLQSELTIDSSTFAGNELIGALSTTGVSIAVDFISTAESAVFTLINSTIDEDATTGHSAIELSDNQGRFEILYSTISAAVPLRVDSGEVPIVQYVASTILQSGVGQPDLVSDTDAIEVEYSILSKAQTAAVADLGGTQFATNAQLGPLQDNGGRTDTRMPAATSPAVGKGGPTLGAPLYDQRFEGFPRIVGTLDVGAVEVPPALANTGAQGTPFWVWIIVGAVVVLGAGAVVFSILNRRKGGSPTAGGPAEASPGGGDALFPEASTEPPTAEPPATNDPR